VIYFKTADLSHVTQITDLVNSAYRGDGSKVGWTTEADFLDGQRTDNESIQGIILEPNNSIELAFEEGNSEILGLVHLKVEASSTLYFGMLTVNPNSQSAGVGKKIISHIEAIAKEKHLSKLRISVINLRGELIEFYERRGFKSTGISIPFPADPRFGIPKVAGLKLLEFERSLV
jgi:ribosomal protein S18 acetylase RimI-like enzyme